MGFALKKTKPHKTRDGKIGITLAEHNIDTIIDVGANIGQTRDSLRANGFKGDIISIEPLPTLQDLLQDKAKSDNKWTVLEPLALGDKDGTCEINISEASDMSSLMQASDKLIKALPKTKYTGSATVKMKTLDSLYSELNLEGKRVFLKMDTQGYEMKILENAQKTLEKIQGIQVEMSLFPLYEDEVLFDDIIAFLKQYGFSPYMLIETNFSRTLKRQLQVDGIFYKE